MRSYEPIQENEENVPLNEIVDDQENSHVNYGAFQHFDTESIDFEEENLRPIFRPTVTRIRPRETYDKKINTTFLLNILKKNKTTFIIAGVAISLTALIIIIMAISKSTEHNHDHDITMLPLTKENLFSGSTISYEDTTTQEMTSISSHETTPNTPDPRCEEIPICCDQGVWICNKTI